VQLYDHENDPLTIVLQIRTSLTDWTVTVKIFRDILLKGHSQSSSLPTNLFLPSSSSTSSPEQVVLLTGLSNLVSATKNINDIKYYRVMVNIQLVIFALCWFGLVRS
jgi:hypothetical protein